MRIVGDIAKSILDFRNQASNPSEIATHILQLPNLNPAIARSLQDRISSLSSNDAPELQNLFIRYLMEKGPQITDEMQKQELCLSAFPLLSVLTDDRQVDTALDIFYRIPVEKRSLFLDLVKAMPPSQDPAIQERNLRLCASDLALTLAQSMETPSEKESLLHHLDRLGSLETAPREAVENIKTPPYSQESLKALRYFPQSQWGQVLTYWKSLPDHLEAKEFELIKKVCSQNRDLLPSLHEFLHSKLTATTDRTLAHDLASVLQEHMDDFLIPWGSDFAHDIPISLEDSSESGAANFKNPYTLYERLLEMRQEPMPVLNLQPSCGYDRSYVMQPQEMLRQAPPSIRKQDLPPHGDFESFKTLWENLSQRIAASPQNQEILNEIKNSTGEKFSDLHNDALSNNTLKHLFELPNASDVVPFETAYLFALVGYAQSLSNEVIPPSLLSSQEEFLIKAFASIQGCPAGRKEGVIAAYHNTIPASHKYPGSTIEIAAHRPAFEFIRSVVYDTVNNEIQSNSLFMQSCCNDPDVSQLSHQSLYVKNCIGRFLGLSSSIEFDRHTEVLSDSLVLMSLQQMLNAFYHFITPEKLILALQTHLKHKTVEEQKAICESLSTFCAADAPAIEEEESDEMLYQAHFKDEMCTELAGFSLTDKGCAAMLSRSGFIKNAYPGTPIAGILLYLLKFPTKESSLIKKLPQEERALYNTAKQQALGFGFSSSLATSYATQKILLEVLNRLAESNPSQAHLLQEQLPKNLQTLINISQDIPKAIDCLHLIQHLSLDLSSEEMNDFIEIALVTPLNTLQEFAIRFPLLARCSSEIYDLAQSIEETIPLEEKSLFVESLLSLLAPLTNEQQKRLLAALKNTPNPSKLIPKLHQILKATSAEEKKKLLSLVDTIPLEKRLLFIESLSKIKNNLPPLSFQSILSRLPTLQGLETEALVFLNNYPPEEQSKIIKALFVYSEQFKQLLVEPLPDAAGISGDGILCLLRLGKLDRTLALEIAAWYDREVPRDQKQEVLSALDRFNIHCEPLDLRYLCQLLLLIPSTLRKDTLLRSLTLKSNQDNYRIRINNISKAPLELRPYFMQLTLSHEEFSMNSQRLISYLQTVPNLKRQEACGLLLANPDIFPRFIMDVLGKVPFEQHSLLCKARNFQWNHTDLYRHCLKCIPLESLYSKAQIADSFSSEVQALVMILFAIPHLPLEKQRQAQLQCLEKIQERFPKNQQETLQVFSFLSPEIKNRVYYFMYEQARSRGEDTSDPFFGEHAFLNPSLSIENKIAALERVKEELTA